MSQLSLVRARTQSSVARLGTAARLAAVAGGLLVGAAACSDNNKTPTAPAAAVELSVTPSVVTVLRGQTAQVDVTATGTTNSAVTWTSFKPSIATISSSGLITGVADGQTFFTATSQADPTKQISVAVNVVSTIVTVSPTAVYSWVGGPTRTITKTVENNANTSVTWTSSNAAVATVSSTGVVTPVAAGTAQIVAKSVADPLKSAATTFTVDPAPPAATELTSGVAITGLSGGAGSAKYYRIAVPVGATKLVFATTGGGAGADIDIYVTPAVIPTYANEQFHAFTASAEETITITNPQSRYYFLFLDGYTAYTDLTVTATVTP